MKGDNYKLLYLDVDGVLLGHPAPDDIRVCLATHAREFLEFALEHFTCYWLTSHCRGDSYEVMNLLLEITLGKIKEHISKTLGVSLNAKDETMSYIANMAKTYLSIATDLPDPDFRNLTLLSPCPDWMHKATIRFYRQTGLKNFKLNTYAKIDHYNY